MITVTSKRPRGTQAPGATIVYIGRPSVLGNPFPMSKESERAQVIEQYRDWLRAQYKTNPRVRSALESLAARSRAGEHLALQCWCAPLPCHGDVIAEAIAGINKES